MSIITKAKEPRIDTPFKRKPSPPKKHTSTYKDLLLRYRKPRLLTILLSIVAFLFFLHLLISARIPSLTPPPDCSALIRSTDYTQSVNLDDQNQEMPAVEFVSQLDGGAPATLVEVYHKNTQHALDIYIFGCVIRHKQPALTTLLALRGVPQGTAEISQANTLLVGQPDTKLPPDSLAFLQPLQQNVYHEYAWQHGAFVQTLFPAFYPVASRAEAEALQQEFDNGQNMPWNDPLVTAQQMTRDLLQWTDTPQGIVHMNNGSTAQIELDQRSPHIQLFVTLQRLIQNDGKGLWFITSAHTQGVALDHISSQSSPFLDPLTPPAEIQGNSVLTDGHTTAALFDHTLTVLSTAPLQVKENGAYSGTLLYSNLIAGQQGILVIASYPQPNNNAIESGQVLILSVLLG